MDGKKSTTQFLSFSEKQFTFFTENTPKTHKVFRLTSEACFFCFLCLSVQGFVHNASSEAAVNVSGGREWVSWIKLRQMWCSYCDSGSQHQRPGQRQRLPSINSASTQLLDSRFKPPSPTSQTVGEVSITAEPQEGAWSKKRTRLCNSCHPQEQ